MWLSSKYEGVPGGGGDGKDTEAVTTSHVKPVRLQLRAEGATEVLYSSGKILLIWVPGGEWTPDVVQQGSPWAGSPGICAGMEAPGAREVGRGAAEGGGSQRSVFIV